VLETSAESRFKLIKFIEGAFFLDAGNVWRLGNSLQTDEKSQFSLDRFYKEIAVGTGVGLRLNFTFLLVRFDWGMKVYDPAYPLEERFVIKDWSFDNITNKKEYGLLNIGIGYPF
jgi:outer membrane protein assembly factor BamA